MGMVTNRVSVVGCPWFYIEVTGITAGPSFGKACAVGYFTDTTKIAELLGPGGVTYHSRSILDKVLHNDFNSHVADAISKLCPDIVFPKDLPDED
jgi:hypothetical protein